ncbi:MAG: dihydroorotate dehydrogenase [Candidatus Altiarchaeota archaeon]|nr:dihydroorotate dehydrogenase [Candidatus Altiarchaeota archaeon]
MADLKTELCGVELRNPTILASGVLGTFPSSLKRAADMGAGAVTIKSIGSEKREGHKNPTMVEVEGGYLNAIGLSTPPLNETLEEIREYKKISKTPMIASFYATVAGDFSKVTEKIAAAGPDLLEVNISCPNVQDEFGTPFSCDPKKSAKIVKSIKKATGIPLLVKLSPNVPSIAQIAKAVERAGADGITAINTVGPGMVIDLKTRAPVLANKRGGMSGPAIKPIMVRCVYDIFEVVDIPIVATGGIMTGEDAAEAIMAGARAVGIGTAIGQRGVDIFKKITKELDTFMNKEGYRNLDQMRGVAHG